MRKGILFLFLTIMTAGLLPLAGCSEQKTEQTTEAVDTLPLLITRIQQCSRLYTAECHLHKIITHTDKMNVKGQFLRDKVDIDLPFGERRIAIPMMATVKASIDFSHFSEKNVQRHGRKLTIILPDPQLTITGTRIDHGEVRKHVPMLRGNFTDAELTSYEQQGRAAIVKALPGLDLVEKARLSAAHTLIPMFVAMGYDEHDVTLTFRKDFSAHDYPQLLEIKN